MQPINYSSLARYSSNVEQNLILSVWRRLGDALSWMAADFIVSSKLGLFSSKRGRQTWERTPIQNWILQFCLIFLSPLSDDLLDIWHYSFFFSSFWCFGSFLRVFFKSFSQSVSNCTSLANSIDESQPWRALIFIRITSCTRVAYFRFITFSGREPSEFSVKISDISEELTTWALLVVTEDPGEVLGLALFTNNAEVDDYQK